MNTIRHFTFGVEVGVVYKSDAYVKDTVMNDAVQVVYLDILLQASLFLHYRNLLVTAVVVT
jgi:hypothetical protein